MIGSAKRVETDRLILRNFRRRDATSLPALLNDWDVARWLARVPYPYGKKDAKEWIRLTRLIRRRREGMPLAIVDRNGGALIGGVGISFQGGEIGYWLGQSHWGQGFGTEAVVGLRDHGFSELGLPQLWAAVRPGNDSSCNILEKAGFERAGTRAYQFRDGTIDALYYRLKRETWKKLQ